MNSTNYNDTFFAIADILGYTQVSNFIKQHVLKPEESQILVDRIFETTRRIISQELSSEKIKWHWDQDGYVFYTEDSDPENLEEMVTASSRILALCNSASIPLRIAITRGQFEVRQDESGYAFTGGQWLDLNKYEKSLDWMGGLLYLPTLDNTHYPKVKELIEKTFLIEQGLRNHKNIISVKNGCNFHQGKYWGINWFKVFHNIDSVSQMIDDWWSTIYQHPDINKNSQVATKQSNSKLFAQHCNSIRKSIYLLHSSKIYSSPYLDEILN